LTAPRVAITTDWLTSFGGAERVLQHLLRLYPNAPVYTSVYDPAGVPDDVRTWTIRPTSLQALPGVRYYSRALLPLMPRAFSKLDLTSFDVVISGASAFAKSVTTRTGAKHICYCHTPPRYLWDLWDEYRRRIPASTALTPLVAWLRMQDRASADGVDQFVANSKNVADRIARAYGRESVVVNPPVDTDRIRPTGRAPENFFLVVARLVAYKRIDLAVDACTRLGRELLVVGHGPERARLEKLAGPTVRFLGARSDAEVAELYARCRAFLFPGLEDFGIAAVEAQAAGRPVIAFAEGGAIETVIDGHTGVYFHQQSVDAVVDAVERFEAMTFDPKECRRNAERFDGAVFRRQMEQRVNMAIGRGPDARYDEAVSVAS
jgi:glycosyltransferase involved in cell wall biosynthesis